MQNNIRIVLAEDQELVRKSLVSLFREFPGMTVVGEACNGKVLIDLLKATPADIVLLDSEMPVMNGVQALEIINKRFPDVKVIVLSMHNDMNLIYEFMMLGARAYLPKNSDVETLMSTIRTVKNYGYYFCQNVANALLKGSMKHSSINPLMNERSLTSREMQILQKLCDGQSNKEIASTLSITPRTVDFHRGNIYSKTGSANIADLIHYSIKNGLVSV